MGISGDLEEWLGTRLSPTLLYDHPSIEALSRHLGGTAPEPPEARQAPPPVDGSAPPEPIAIIGLACRFPGAPDPAAFWRLVSGGVDAIREVPPDRWDNEALFDPTNREPGKMSSRHGGFLEQVDRFEPAFFGISAHEAERLDPQQRLLLEVTWEALEDAGVPPERLSGTATGVFVGISTNDYGRLQLDDPSRIDAWAGTGNARSIAANRISYQLGLSGPSLAVDSACSSSLVALHLACQSLRERECEVALVGAVNVMLSPELTMIFAKAGLLAPDGRCKVFDARADGYVRGEGAGVVVLKPLSAALASGDDFYAVIRGSAVNQDGRTNGLMAPNGPAQETVIRRAYRNAGIDPGEVLFVEAHGTGTALGDRIEAGALGAAMSSPSRREACWIGSVKTNIGHLEAAAGMAGLIKAVLALRHRQIPPSIHFETPSPMIDFAALGLRVADRPRALPADGSLVYAGVSSFGFGGTNAHVVLEEPPARPPAAPDGEGWQLLVLSARTPRALDAMSARLGSWLEAHPEVSLGEVAFTLRTGRSLFEHRRAVLARSREHAVEILREASGAAGRDEVLSVPWNRAEPEEARLLRDLGRAWLAGRTVDWQKAGAARRSAGLPTYPFERQRYWLDAEAPPRSALALSPEESKGPLEDWFHVPVWNPVPLDPGPTEASPPETSPVLVFCDEHGLGEGLAERVRQAGRPVVQVRPGAGYGSQGDLRTLSPAAFADYESLLDGLPALPGEIVHLWSVGADPAATREEAGRAQTLGIESVVHLVRAVGERAGERAVRFTLVASGMAEVTGGDLVSPAKATLSGPCRVIPFEYPRFSSRCIDLEAPASPEARELLAGQLLREIESGADDQIVAYRGRDRYVQSIVRSPIADTAGLRLRQGGVYLLTGGLGGLGLSAARFLAEKYRARLALLSRSGLPPREQWESLRAAAEDDVSPTRRAQEALPHRIREVMAIEEAGGELLLIEDDVTDPVQMRSAVQQVLDRFGALHGVFHTAGVIGAGMIAFNPKDSLARVMPPKLAGTLALDEALEGVELDFLVLYSSLAALIGGTGQVAYSAANAFLDAFAIHRSRRGRFTVAVGWGEWQWNVWEGFAPEVHALLEEHRLRFGIAPDEGFEAVVRILAQDRPHVAVLTRPFEALRAWFAALAVDTMSGGASFTTEALVPRLGAGAPALPPLEELERIIAGIWQRFFGTESLGLDDNFFDAGGNSLVGLQIINELRRTLGVELPKVALFQAPTVRSLARYLQSASGGSQDAPAASAPEAGARPEPETKEAVAIIGMGLRFPGARSVEQFWSNLAGGVESVTYFTDEELDEVPPALLANPDYVKARPVLENLDLFDADFFGYSPGEARLMDPQIRLFLETCWEALESSGYAVENLEARAGVFAGANISTYLLALLRKPGFIESVGELETVITNDRDSLATSVSYKLNLKGPSLSVQTFCSTSAVAIHLACKSVLRNECEMALAGGVSVRVPSRSGYLYRHGDQYSPDGHTRAFDHRAHGTVFGDGVGVVVLKRLSAALRDGDHIHAVIRGSAVNNDGSLKAGYTAPSVEGQAAVVAAALADAGVKASEISYVEAHGTATVLGDPIEVAALTQAFRQQTFLRQYCALGSVKTNIGHLDRAASVASVIKTALALEHRQIPPSLHFEGPNPDIPFDSSPFFVNAALREWTGEGPRRASINCLGIGGTNAHLVLEEAPAAGPPGESRRHQLILLSARSATALDQAATRLARHLRGTEDSELPDIAYTLQVGRKMFTHRRAVVCDSREAASAALEAGDGIGSTVQGPVTRQITFLFPGIGEHDTGMAAGLYRDEPVFREQVDRCADLLRELGEDDPLAALPLALFVVEYALARLLMSWGLKPRALLGHGLGEYVAACVAGVFTVEDALRLMASLGRWIEDLPDGAMVAVPLSEEEIRPLLGEELALAALHGPGGVVVSGPPAPVAELEAGLAERGIASRRLPAARAFHSHHLDPVADRVAELVASMELGAPSVPLLSNVTGKWISRSQARDPRYWARQLSQTVRFSDAVKVLLGEGEQVLLEVGPGAELTSLVHRHPECDAARAALAQPALDPSLGQDGEDQARLLATLGRLWLHGLDIDWRAFYKAERRVLRPLPTYPFERKSYWIDARPAASTNQGESLSFAMEELVREPDVQDWFYEPVWTPAQAPEDGVRTPSAPWWAFVDASPFAERLVERLAAQGETVVAVTTGTAYGHDGARWVLDPAEPDHYRRLVEDLGARAELPRRILHLWELAAGTGSVNKTLDRGFHSLIYLARALSPTRRETVELNVVTSGVYAVAGGEVLHPLPATVTGPVQIVPVEYPAISVRHVDLELPEPGNPEEDELLDALFAEVHRPPGEREVAFRHGERLVRSYAHRPLVKSAGGSGSCWRPGGVYLITGGLGGLGLAAAEHLASTCGARLVLVGRTALPPREEWDRILESGAEQGMARRIAKVQALEDRGIEVLVLTADVADRERMREVVAVALARFGTIHGVLHTAGVPAAGLMHGKSAADFARVMAAKVQGTLVLEEVLRDVPLDFLVLFSSITAVVGGGPGQVDYCAANAFLDAFARARSGSGRRVVSIDWGEWRWNDWEWSMAGLPPEALSAFRRNRERLGIDFEGGMDALERVLASDLSSVVVSPADFTRIVEITRRYTIDLFLGPAADPGAGAPQGVARTARELESLITDSWRRALGREQIGLDDNFFDLGGNSLLGLKVTSELQRELRREILPLALYEAPTVRALTAYLQPPAAPAAPARRAVPSSGQVDGLQGIAIIGMAGRFPGAANVEELWRNLLAGRESVTFFSDDELLAAGVDPALLANPRYVKAGAVLDEIDRFDAELFGESPREAEILDPQLRLFMECAWEALDDAGYDPRRYPGKVGVFGGANLSTYLLQMAAAPEQVGMLHPLLAGLGNSSDALATRVSYKLNLRGPSVSVQTFCSTSGVAAHLACGSLQQGDCDMALAGGVRVAVPHRVGYLYEPGGIESPDGHIRTFDARAQGMVLGNGVAILLLKRLADALADGDHIYAVIKGSAINNDGSGKVGYTAPSVNAVADVVSRALEKAQVPADTITYVETHGTATEVGDPIEMAALSRAFRAHTVEPGSGNQYCAIGSVKSNLGHLDRAAGTTALIKTALALERAELPPSISFERPNPKLDLEHSPFFVLTKRTRWETKGHRRRAGVNIQGIGGTNVHFILEEPPAVTDEERPSRPLQMLALSANTATALETLTDRLVDHLREASGKVDLPDVASTLQRGRQLLKYRRFVVCRDTEDAVACLASRDSQRVASHCEEPGRRPVYFLFPGQGTQYPGMGRGLYEQEAVFRSQVDLCCREVEAHLGRDLRELLFPAAGEEEDAARELARTELTHPSLFVIEYALARQWMAWGIQPEMMIGHSLGEYVAACLSGVFSLSDALALVTARGQLISELPGGAMLNVPLPASEVAPLLGPELSLAAVNGPRQSTVSGPEAPLAALEKQLVERGVRAGRLRTSHAFHSAMMDPVLDRFRERVAAVSRQAPRWSWVSNVTGTKILPEQAVDPGYWVRHLRETVRFADGARELLSEPGAVFLEVGPGRTLTTLVGRQAQSAPVLLASLRAPQQDGSDLGFLLDTLGKLWLSGIEVDWDGFYCEESRRRVALPAYPFEGERYWLGPRGAVLPAAVRVPAAAPGAKKADPADWYYRPEWRPAPLPSETPAPDAAAAGGSWLLFVDGCGVGRSLAESLQVSALATVGTGDRFERVAVNEWRIDPGREEDYARLLQELGFSPGRVVHLWSVTQEAGGGLADHQKIGFSSLLRLARALVAERVRGARLEVVTNRLEGVAEGDPVEAAKSTLPAAVKVLRQEYPGLASRLIEIDPDPAAREAASALASELQHGLVTDLEVAYRNGARWLRHFEPVRLEPASSPTPLREGGVYLITGGLGGVGLVLAEELARKHRARLALVSRTRLPEREEWPQWAAEHGEDDPTTRKIRRIETLEALGAQVLVLAADVGDAAAQRAVLARVEETYGEIHGVLHAAGITGRDGFQQVQLTGDELCERHFRAKVHGLDALAEVLGDRPLDFCLLFSSLSSVLGGLGFAAYAAANSYLNGFARARRRDGDARWLAVAWDSWRLDGGAGTEAREKGLDATVEQYGMTSAEGTDAFGRILAAHAADPSVGPVLVHSTGDLDARIEQWLRRTAKPAAARPEGTRYTRPDLRTAYVPVNNESERKVARVFEEILGVEKVGVHDNFFDLGGTSLTALQVVTELQREFPGVEINPVTLFDAPTVAGLAKALGAEGGDDAALDRLRATVAEGRELVAPRESIAIVGMSGRFPGAPDIERFWQNLVDGVETVSYFTDEELAESGVDPRLIGNPDYVRARPVLEDIDQFDAVFFGYSPREAELMDPQMRLLMETCWQALESAGYAPGATSHKIGMFAGSNFSTYFLSQLRDPRLIDSIGELQASITNDRDSLATSISYKLNLKGPSLTVQTFCSTSSVAVHLACQSLRQGDCGMALAGGVSLRVPAKVGYVYQAGDQVSPDGHTRTFDHRAAGTVFGDGVGVLVLKRLSDALRDGDQIHAVLRGSAINNDGSDKAGYTAPSVEGQAEVVATALANAGVDASEIGYVEAHGTATVLGDPIEVAALTRAFQLQTAERGYCPLGSVKTNMGHLDRAAGVTALIKTALALEHGQIPPSLHFECPNPNIDFAASPFFVNTELREWKRNGRPRRAGVNSLGVGGTNVHLVLEEAPELPPTSASRRHQLLVVSARSATALAASCSRLAAHLESVAERDLADVAFTLQVGRRDFTHRRIVVCTNRTEALAGLTGDGRPGLGVASAVQEPVSRQTAFLFPGIGDHYVGMTQGLYRDEWLFRDEVDRCAAILAGHGMEGLMGILYPERIAAKPAARSGGLDLRGMLRGGGREDEASARLNRISHLHPALFVVEYALARLLMSWGVVPQAMLGYSLGEYVAACLSGVFSLEDALRLVAARGRWIEELPEGAMLAVPVSEAEIAADLGEDLDLAAANGSGGCVVSGSPAAVATLEKRLAGRDVVSRRLHSTRAFHSRLLEPVAGRVIELLSGMRLHAPEIPFVSNVTGTWITPHEATDPSYWAHHLCRTVRFSDGVAELLKEPSRVLVEVGPGQGLTSFVRLHPDCGAERAPRIRPTLRASFEDRADQAYLLECLGRLWLAGVAIDWRGFHAGESRRRRRLPTYPFERQSYWLGGLKPEPPAPAVTGVAQSLADLVREPNVEDWLYVPVWEPSPLASMDNGARKAAGPWWVFLDGPEAGSFPARLAERLEERGDEVYRIFRGTGYGRDGRVFTLDPERPEDYRRLVRELGDEGRLPARVVHLWDLEAEPGSPLEETLDRGFHSLIYLAQALGPRLAAGSSPGDVKVEINVVSRGVHPVLAGDWLRPERATVLGTVTLIPLEFPAISCRHLDVQLEADLLEPVAAELDRPVDERLVAYRSRERFVRRFPRRPLPPAPAAESLRFRRGGVYLITGGFGGLGLATAEHLASTLGARLVLVGRTGLPPREEWDAILAGGGLDGLEKGPGRAIARIRALEEQGIEILALRADVADREQMQAVVDAALARFGALHGVFHTAGVPGSGLLQHRTAADFARVLGPKVQGTQVLDEVLRPLPLDLLVLFSSATAVTGGGPGQVAYCAANAFLDAYAQARSTADRFVVSIGWNEWRWNAWESAMEGLPPQARRFFAETRERLGIDFAGGMDALERIVASDSPHFVVSPPDFEAALALSRDYTVDLFLGRDRGTPVLAEADAGTPAGRHARPELKVAYAPPASDLERRIAEIWQRALGIEEVGVSDNFFDLGGNSLIGLKVTAELQRELGREVLPLALYEAPTVGDLARHLQPESAVRPVVHRSPAALPEEGIAIIGMAGRFPGAASVEELWRNLLQGREGVTFFSDQELLAAGVDPELLADPRYVKAGAVLDGIERFDADLFDVPPEEAALLDPQHRLFLECAWAALEDAGHDPARHPGRIGVFGGSHLSTYLLQIATAPELRKGINRRLAGHCNATDTLTTRVSYKLNLRGPSIAVQTFSSTSGVAVHLACESLHRGGCEMALAGGVQVSVPHRVGYFCEPDGIDSQDGHTRSFDIRAGGALQGNGVAIVVLKRLSDALQDGDHVYAVIKGSAVNNDGSGKVGFTAPSVMAVADVVHEALGKAGVSPDTISYVEANGGATEVGDAIEVAALTRAFQVASPSGVTRTQYCALGSVKPSVGHLLIAAGATALIKTSLALKHGEIPPTLNFSEPNPQLHLEQSPFYVQKDRTLWRSNGTPRRAGVNIQGVGGTNVHLILEEPPAIDAGQRPSMPRQLLVLSANTASALEAMTNRLVARLRDADGSLDLADVCATLQQGRKLLRHRRSVVCRDVEDAISCLESRDPQRVSSHFEPAGHRPVCFLFPGQGELGPGLWRELYEHAVEFRSQVDDLCQKLVPLLGCDLRNLLLSAAGEQEELSRAALFTVEYALARQWMAWGVVPQRMLGHGAGELVAACLTGALALEDALPLVVAAPGDEEPRHLDAGLDELLSEPRTAFVEVGPGGALVSRLRARAVAEPLLHASLPPVTGDGGDGSELGSVLDTLGKLWLLGVAIDWQELHRQERRLRVSLPTYPFEGGNHWIGPPVRESPSETGNGRRIVRSRARQPQNLEIRLEGGIP